MSPSTTEQPDLERPEAPNHEEHPDLEAARLRKERSGFFSKHRAAKPIVILLVVVAVLLVGWFWWESRHWEDTDDAEIDGHIYPINARVSGQVIKVNYDDGQVVRKGDVLVQIDPTDYQVALERAKADYLDSQAQAQAAQYGVPVQSVGSVSSIRSASADMDSAQAGVAAARKQVDAAQQQVVEAKANAVKLNKDVERYQQLLGRREISQQQFDAAVAAATAENATVSAEAEPGSAVPGESGRITYRAGQRRTEERACKSEHGGRYQGQGRVRRCPGVALQSGIGPGATELGLHDHRCAGGRRRR